jgi:hypothetical protein
MKIVFIGRSKFGQYCLNNLKKHSVVIINPVNFNLSDFENADIVFYSRNISRIDFNFLKKIKKVNTNIRFIFLDTELNKNVITINTSLLIKKIEFYFLSRFFKNIERYYIPIVLGNNMNWTKSLSLMKSKNIPLLCFKNGLINIVTIEDLIKDIIQKKQISVKSISIHNFAKTNNIKLKIINESVFKKIIFHIKYNLITSFILLIKNQIKSRGQNFSYNKKVSVITLIDFYKLIINE